MLALNNIGAAYGMSQVLSGIDMTVQGGEAVALLGRNGVGKTTLLRTIVGLHAANTGTIAFGDDEVVKMPAYRRARLGIGYVPQGRGIFPQLTVAENLSVGSSALEGRKPAVAPDPGPLYDLFPALVRLRDRKGGVRTHTRAGAGQGLHRLPAGRHQLQHQYLRGGHGPGGEL